MSEPHQSWRKLARAKDVVIEPKGILVRFADGRSHHLTVIDQPDHWILRGLIVRHADATFDPKPMLAAALRNRQLRLCGLSVDERGKLWGQAMVPKAGLDTDEFLLCTRHLAAECDRLEYLLTGRNRE